MDLHPLAAVGFGSASDVYERARPSYPAPAVEHLCAALHLTAGSRVLDLAAGTGKLTRLLAAHDLDLRAVEPSASMREQFTRRVPTVPVVDGTAEHIPFDDASFDALVVAQAFHWFDHDRALEEIARVLRPGGGLGIIRNERDEHVHWVRAMSEAMRWHTEAPRLHAAAFGEIIAEHSQRFEPVRHEQFAFVQELTRDGIVDRAASASYVVAMEPPERAALLEQVRAIVADFDEPIALPYITDTFTTRRRDQP